MPIEEKDQEGSIVSGVESDRDKSDKKVVRTNSSLTRRTFGRPFRPILNLEELIGSNISKGPRNHRRKTRRYWNLRSSGFLDYF